MTEVALRVVLRRLTRWRQSKSATDKAMKTMPLRTPPTIAAVFLLLLW
jgi:hypothetical protein